MVDKAKRLEKIRQAKAELEAEARAAAAAQSKARAEAQDRRKAEGGKTTGTTPAPPRRSPTARRNATSPIPRAAS